MTVQHISTKLITLFILLISNTVVSKAEDIAVSGFVSIGIGKLLEGEAYLTDYPKAARYKEDWSFAPDSTLGLQLNTQVNKKSSFIVQAVSHGALGYEMEIDWAYLNYTLNSEVTLQAGRKRLPLYYYTDHFDIAYTYYWVRPPTDSYTWQISNYNGISLLYESVLSDWDTMINVYAGREDSEDNELLSMLTNKKVDESWKNMIGVVVEASRSWLELRFTVMQGQLDRTIDEIEVESSNKQLFYGMAANASYENIIFLSEFSHYERKSSDIDVNTLLISAGYHMGDFIPHITYSALKQEENMAGGDEEHSTRTFGIRWDADSNIAVKIQYDKVEDVGESNRIFGDGELISLSIDMIF